MGEGWHFTDWGYKVTTQDQLTRAIARIGALSLSRKYVWRGVPDHRWRMNSSLYRLLTEKLGRKPNERDMRAQELQLLASLQHPGLPTRIGRLAGCIGTPSMSGRSSERHLTTMASGVPPQPH